MSHINNITIENFRQFYKLEVAGLKRVNFLVGQNNCGKTSLLEAIFLCSYPTELSAIGTIHDYRRMRIALDSMTTFFLRKEEYNAININIETDSQEQFSRSIMLDERNSNEIKSINDSKETSSVKEYSNKAMYNSEQEEYKIVVTSSDSSTSISFKEGQSLPKYFGIKTLYISNIVNGVNAKRLNSAINERRENELLEYLKIFDEKVSWIGFGAGDSILVDIKDGDREYRLPLSVMGDGFIRFASILVDMLFEKKFNEVILIDEIENGLHYSNIKPLFRAILKLSKEKNIQMFITTHSYETLTFLSEVVCEDYFSDKANMQVINLDKTTSKGFKSYAYTMDGLSEFIETNTEIRE